MKRTFELRNAARLIGVSPRRLAGWAERELLVPNVAGEGKGSRRQYSLLDIFMGVLLLKLQEMAGDHSVLPQQIDVIRAAVEEAGAEDFLSGKRTLPKNSLLLLSPGPGAVSFTNTEELKGEPSFLDIFIGETFVVTLVPVYQPLAALLERLRAET